MKKELIGRKVKGLHFGNGMDNGEIYDYYENNNSYIVKFGKYFYYYPAALIEQHLVEDNLLDSLPMLGEGVLCEVWNNDENTVIRFVCARTPNGYLFWNNTNKKEDINYKGVTYCKNARPIEPVKKYTKEQLEDILGHPFELI